MRTSEKGLQDACKLVQELLALEITPSCFTVVAMYIAGWLSQSAYHLQNLLLSLENEETVYFLQNIPIKGSSVHCRTLWDKGSNRVLIRDSFTLENNLVSKEVTYKMEVFGSNEVRVV